MKKITYRDISEKILKKFDIHIHLEKISVNKSILKIKSKKYKHVWIDSDEFCKEKYDNIYIKYDKTEDVDYMKYDILFDHIKKYEKYYLMYCDENGDNLLFQIPKFESEEELALKMELIG